MVARNLHISDAERARTANKEFFGDFPAPLEHPATAERIAMPVDPDNLLAIASDGFPLWEQIPILQLRNYRVTLAYANLSERLAKLIARTGIRDANWCTFAAWSSRTVGESIDAYPVSAYIRRRLAWLPAWAGTPLDALGEKLLDRQNGDAYRALAVGNRFVFREIGTAVVYFIAQCPVNDGDFEGYWNDVAPRVVGLVQLDPSWVVAGAPNIQLLKQGMHAYYKAMTAPDQTTKSQFVLAGNLLVAAYEQERVQLYLAASLGFFPARSLNRIMRIDETGITEAFSKLCEAAVSSVYASFITRYFLFVELPGVKSPLRVGKPLPALEPNTDDFFPVVLKYAQIPLLQALLAHYDRARNPAQARARNWMRYSERMSYITNLFRSRQRDERLFDEVWTTEQQEALLKGELPPK